ncbi:shematrin-like protein 2 [Drosophila innubila]|uniref:shematrin-like protein 2 n=1 Tax=Drosophila innubila TaxID=198719 RepID=UPI00148D6582|nr:shematrin-like protein 2 [Drosophila innubila]
MKYLCVFVIFAMCLVNCLAAIAEPAAAAPDAEVESTVAEKKTEKRGIYGFGYGHYGHGYGGYGHGHGHYGGYGFASPYYGGYEYVHHATPYYGGHHGGFYPYHHGHYGYY